MQGKISNHNRHLLEKKMKPAASNGGCNCQKKDQCPLNNQCLTTNTVYKAEIADVCGDTKEYIGVTAGTFKKRYANHMNSLNIGLQRYSTETELSKYAWTLKEERKPFTIKW